MTKIEKNIYSGLERIFHEPSRLAIISALCASDGTLSFNQLKDECNLTFGNISSHLKTLGEAGIIQIQKSFVNNKPHTKVSITDKGRDRFIEYLKTLENVLKKAAKAVQNSNENISFPLSGLKPAQS